MSSLSPVLAPAPAVLRDSVPPGPVPPVATPQSAQAIQPADPLSALARQREARRDDRPVGPPPAFKVNVLQAIRQRLAEPDPPADAPFDAAHLDKKV